MINRNHYGIITFSNSQAAAQAEIKIQASGFECRLIPLPEQIHSGCGLVLQFSLEDLNLLRNSLSDLNNLSMKIYEVILSKNRKKTVLLLEPKEE
ncbi:DUF3343 domain-containing protein [Jeotgalibaca sp. MA1X17-3]|uniref:DUF3343 domain-containing protein n=1 Tax=Jeotgalibaca sp. MA1X17-3 TaxID=2908211 RepID=UPI001F22EFE0|nr:DUF3343 domain-containing protein [Jeotgalibaca sp. MA1X17-3]UJF16387.1 DUF3343 domain-containing protein [Jeotgalibaca sp. MA1X17-3]